MTVSSESDKAFQDYVERTSKEKRRYEENSRDVSDKAVHNFAGCATDDHHELIVCIWCDPEHDRPWCGDCHARRCQSCDKCKGCKETIDNCICENFPQD